VKIEVLPSRGEHYPLLLPHQKEIAMGILVTWNKRFMRAMAKPEGIFTEAAQNSKLNKIEFKQTDKRGKWQS